MNFAVIGSGGREHAICYKLKQSPKIKKLICIPGNAGTQKIAENIKEDISNFEALHQIIKRENKIGPSSLLNFRGCIGKIERSHRTVPAGRHFPSFENLQLQLKWKIV